jgi:uncharacterized protein YkwD
MLTAVACGIPLSAEEIARLPTATPEPSEEALVIENRLTLSQEAVDTSVAQSDPAPTATAEPTAAATPSPDPTSIPPAATPTPNGATSAATSTPQPTAAPPGPSSSDMASQALKILNDYRASIGRAALNQNAELTALAARYARALADNDWFRRASDAHIGPDGSHPSSRVAASGYSGRFAGEALAGGQTTPQAAISTWLDSPPHAAIILSTAGTDVGIGYYYRPGDVFGHYWVLVTGTR